MMNNKGFAITGILYTIFILFMLTLFAVLSGLNSREKMMKKSIKSFENQFLFYSEVPITSGEIAEEDGLYFYSNSSNVFCYSYLKKGTRFTDAVFIKKNNTDSCVNSSDFVVKGFYKRDYYDE